ncbi:hypothetical protein AMTRI_Chr10g4610 [Amborella trichopoda]
MKTLSWNIRGLGQKSKRDTVRDFSTKLSPSILALTETKQPAPTLQSVHSVWARGPCQWVSLPAKGSSCRIWVVWNPIEYNLLSSHIGDFLVTVLSRTTNGALIKFSSIYGPNSASLCPQLWSELDLVAALPHSAWFLGGDFKITRWSHERNLNTNISQGMLDFSDFISCHELVDIPTQGNAFTWSNHFAQPSLAKLDRFLLSLDWEVAFPDSHALTLPKPTSDHCPILLDTQAFSRWPKPFRFELAWLEEQSLVTLIPIWWNSFSSQVSGREGFKLQTKIQLLKKSLKNWRQSRLGNYFQLKTSWINCIQDLDKIEEVRPLSDFEEQLRTQSKLKYLATLKKEELFLVPEIPGEMVNKSRGPEHCLLSLCS